MMIYHARRSARAASHSSKTSPGIRETLFAWFLAATMTSGKRYTGARWRRLAQYIRKRDHHRCRRCKRGGLLHVHHMKPISRGGSNYPTNLIALCVACHEYEHGFDINGDGRF